MKTQKRSRAMTQAQIEQEVKRCGPSVATAYEEHLNNLKKMLKEATDDSQEELAAFLFAFSQLGNVIATRHSVKH